MIDLSRQEARKIIFASQLLKRPSVMGQSAKRLTKETIEQIGYVQIDTISVVERAHHHVLWSRLPTYSPDILSRLEKERSIFEYWSHAASYLPMRDFRFTLPVKAEIQERDKFWYEKDHKVMQHVLDRIAAEGPLMSKDFEKPEGFKVKEMWDAAPTKKALQNLFMEGRIMVIGRQGFQKIYDLTERVVPSGIDVSTPSRDEYISYLIERDIRAHGILSAKEMGYLIKGCQKEIREKIASLEASGSILPCSVGSLREPYWTNQEALDRLGNRFSHKVKILSPFDNLVINRSRTKELFGFDYTLECYVPAPDRVFGYFGLPITWKDKPVGQMDVKANREQKRLEVRNVDLNLRTINDEFLDAWRHALGEFMHFQGVSEIAVDPARCALGKELLGRLFTLK